jgi:predicted NodU family carbamoyl transferase
MTAILGLSAFYHDSAAVLVVDGRIVAAAQEERFTRIKHDAGFPARAIEYCLAEGKIEPGQLDYVGFYDKPLLKFDRLLETYLAYAPRGFVSLYAYGQPHLVGDRRVADNLAMQEGEPAWPSESDETRNERSTGDGWCGDTGEAG